MRRGLLITAIILTGFLQYDTCKEDYYYHKPGLRKESQQGQSLTHTHTHTHRRVSVSQNDHGNSKAA